MHALNNGKIRYIEIFAGFNFCGLSFHGFSFCGCMCSRPLCTSQSSLFHGFLSTIRPSSVKKKKNCKNQTPENFPLYGKDTSKALIGIFHGVLRMFIIERFCCKSMDIKIGGTKSVGNYL